MDIRPLEKDDLPAVSAVLAKQFSGWARPQSFLEKTLFDHPFAAGDPVSLVSLGADGSVAGFLGAQTRRLSLGDRELTGVCVSQLAVLPDKGSVGAGGLLLAKALSGPQEVTWTDSVTNDVVRMWRVLKGRVDHARAVDFMLVLRPMRWGGAVAHERLVRRTGPRRTTLPVAAMPLQAIGRRVLPQAFPDVPSELNGSDASAAEIVAELATINRKIRLRVVYDEGGLDYQFGLVESLSPRVIRRVVRLGDRVLGWYAYILRDKTTSRLLHLAAGDAASVSLVLAEAAAHARASGAYALAGRAEPHMHGALRERFAGLGYGLQPLVHSRDPEVLALLAGDGSLLTELDSVDSEWWTVPALPGRGPAEEAAAAP